MEEYSIIETFNGYKKIVKRGSVFNYKKYKDIKITGDLEPNVWYNIEYQKIKDINDFVLNKYKLVHETATSCINSDTKENNMDYIEEYECEKNYNSTETIGLDIKDHSNDIEIKEHSHNNNEEIVKRAKTDKNMQNKLQQTYINKQAHNGCDKTTKNDITDLLININKENVKNEYNNPKEYKNIGTKTLQARNIIDGDIKEALNINNAISCNKIYLEKLSDNTKNKNETKFFCKNDIINFHCLAPVLNNEGCNDNVKENKKSYTQKENIQRSELTKLKYFKKRGQKRELFFRILQITPYTLLEIYIFKKHAEVGFISHPCLASLTLYRSARALVFDNIKGLLLYSLLYKGNMDITCYRKNISYAYDILKYLRKECKICFDYKNNCKSDDEIQNTTKNICIHIPTFKYLTEHENTDKHKTNVEIFHHENNTQESVLYDTVLIAGNHNYIELIIKYLNNIGNIILIYTVSLEEAKRVFMFLIEHREFIDVTMSDYFFRAWQVYGNLRPSMNSKINGGYIVKAIRVFVVQKTLE